VTAEAADSITLCCAAVECRVCGSVCATRNLVHSLHFSTRADWPTDGHPGTTAQDMTLSG